VSLRKSRITVISASSYMPRKFLHSNSLVTEINFSREKFISLKSWKNATANVQKKKRFVLGGYMFQNLGPTTFKFQMLLQNNVNFVWHASLSSNMSGWVSWTVNEACLKCIHLKFSEWSYPKPSSFTYITRLIKQFVNTCKSMLLLEIFFQTP
jgi:hypothetical protein